MKHDRRRHHRSLRLDLRPAPDGGAAARRLRVTLLLSDDRARQVLRYETGLDWSGRRRQAPASRCASYFAAATSCNITAINDLFAPMASGSSAPDAWWSFPVRWGRAARIAAGISEQPARTGRRCRPQGAAASCSWFRAKPRSTVIHLRNLLSLARAGAEIVPAMPAFYHRPQTLEELVDFVVGKMLDSLGIEHQLFRAGGKKAEQVRLISNKSSACTG